MPRSREELSAGEWAVLALLSEGPAHGFALARAMAPGGEVGQVWSMRRPLVYRALETLEQREFVRPAGQVPSQTGPQRSILEVTPAGARAVNEWLGQPVDHVRDARSLLMLKLLFLSRLNVDPSALLTAQRAQFSAQAERLQTALDETGGFDRALLLWRLETTAAAVRFTETMLANRTAPPPAQRRGRPRPRRTGRP
ncbi:MAG TPA: helix-turn-helix transcriptional regulator [Solirubrobacteraceae bacterium]|nr:helix-turn-helix transcriptional regulator [Solirubrobacteraceae bacterium]